jgi:MFS family permease
MVFFTGFAISSFVVPPFQDKFGRKIVFVSSMSI